MENLLDVYQLEKGQAIRVTIPTQYRPSVMYIDGVETELMVHTSAQTICGTFQGMPGATSGFYFMTDKPIHGGLFLLDIDTPIQDVATVRDMIAKA